MRSNGLSEEASEGRDTEQMLTVWSLLHLILKVAQGYSQTPYSLAQLESPSHLLYLLLAAPSA